MPAQIKPKSFESTRNFFFFYSRGGCVSCLRACLGARLLPQSYQYPNLSEGADHVSGLQLRRDKECPFSGATKSGRVWRKVPESDARSVPVELSLNGLAGWFNQFNVLLYRLLVKTGTKSQELRGRGNSHINPTLSPPTLFCMCAVLIVCSLRWAKHSTVSINHNLLTAGIESRLIVSYRVKRVY